MSYEITRNLSLTPSEPSINIQLKIEPTEIELKIQKCEAKLAALCQQQQESSRALIHTKRYSPTIESESNKKLKLDALLSQDNALLEAYPGLKEIFSPENVITFQIPLKDGKEKYFFVPRWVLLDAEMLTNRFDWNMKDTSQKKILLNRPDGTCYQLETMNYVFGRILKQCSPLTHRPKEQVNGILSEVQEFASGYFPALLDDCYTYLKEKVFTDFDDFLSYGTLVFEMEDPQFLKIWQGKLSEYFQEDKSTKEKIIYYLIEDLLPAYGNDFEAYKKARHFVFSFLAAGELVRSTSPHANSPPDIDCLFFLFNALMINGDVQLIRSCILHLSYNGSFKTLKTLPFDQKGGFCKTVLTYFGNFNQHSSTDANLDIVDKILLGQFTDEIFKQNAKLLSTYVYWVEGAVNIEQEVDELLRLYPNNPLAIYMNLCFLVYDTIFDTPEIVEQAKISINTALERFPTNLSLSLLKMTFCKITKQEKEAIPLLSQTLCFDPRREFRSTRKGFSNNSSTYDFAEYYFEQGKLKEAVQLFKGINKKQLDEQEAALLIKIKASLDEPSSQDPQETQGEKMALQ